MNNTNRKAKQFAIDAHTRAESRYGELPYEYHLQKVYDTISYYDYTLSDSVEFLQTCAWLHDTIEDTDVLFKDISEEFGYNVARTVYAVTNEPGKNRSERAERTYPKMIAAGKNAIALKLADRIANVEHSLQYNYDKFKMYKKEYDKFRDMLRLPGELKEMWARLDMLMGTNVED